MAWLALSLFIGVLLATALEWTHLCLAARLGGAAMLLLGVLSPLHAAESLRSGGGTIALLFGMMLVVRALEASSAFNGLAHRLVELSGGQGRRLLLGLVLITVPVAALLPNPSAVLLMAPLMPPMARELKLDFRPLLILMVLAAISASLLTLVGDPARYIIGTGIHWDFARYLRDLGPAALLVLGVVIGGSATVIGSSSNLVTAGVARQQGARLGFRTWMSYGLPTVGLQLAVAWLWCVVSGP